MSAPTTSSSSDSGTLEVDTGALAHAGQQFEDLNNTLAAVVSTLTSTIDGLGEPWGDDSMGKQFASGSSGYLAAKDSLVGTTGALASFGQIFQVYGADIVAAAQAFDAGDSLDGNQDIASITSNSTDSTSG